MGCWGSCAALVKRNQSGRAGRRRELTGGEEMAGGQGNGEGRHQMSFVFFGWGILHVIPDSLLLARSIDAWRGQISPAGNRRRG
jgi:hypothetical protein